MLMKCGFIIVIGGRACLNIHTAPALFAIVAWNPVFAPFSSFLFARSLKVC